MKRFGGETTPGKRESGRNDSGANGIVVETTQIQVNIDTKRVPEVTKVRCIIFSKTAPKSGACTKSTLRSRLHPSDDASSVFTPSVCENQFDLINIVC